MLNIGSMCTGACVVAVRFPTRSFGKKSLASVGIVASNALLQVNDFFCTSGAVSVPVVVSITTVVGHMVDMLEEQDVMF